jgi:hypothetical protein
MLIFKHFYSCAVVKVASFIIWVDLPPCCASLLLLIFVSVLLLSNTQENMPAEQGLSFLNFICDNNTSCCQSVGSIQVFPCSDPCLPNEIFKEGFVGD